MRQKVELIKQIRAVESLPAFRANFVDLAETPGYGLLSEMSIAEVSTNTSSDNNWLQVNLQISMGLYYIVGNYFLLTLM